MSMYHQMGHHTQNLVTEPQLNRYAGLIVSPVNVDQNEAQRSIRRSPDDFEVVFDPQLYFPGTERVCLQNWDYFPNDVDTADVASLHWWSPVIDKVVQCATEIGATAIASPSVIPSLFNDDFYIAMLGVCELLSKATAGTSLRTYHTCVAQMGDLSRVGRPKEIASIVSRSSADRVYLVLVSEVDPRRELSNSRELSGAMQLISALERSGMQVLVGFCSSDIILWMAAGASHCATGKFFNLRRFTTSRFQEPRGGGGQLPYWFEESLVAFLRDGDVLRLRKADALGLESMHNPWAYPILFNIDQAAAWLAESWRQFMWALADMEHRFDQHLLDPSHLLAQAESKWLGFGGTLLFDEALNDGSWLRPWRQALLDFEAPLNTWWQSA